MYSKRSMETPLGDERVSCSVVLLALLVSRSFVAMLGVSSRLCRQEFEKQDHVAQAQSRLA
jgi:hypothetical protein